MHWVPYSWKHELADCGMLRPSEIVWQPLHSKLASELTVLAVKITLQHIWQFSKFKASAACTHHSYGWDGVTKACFLQWRLRQMRQRLRQRKPATLPWLQLYKQTLLQLLLAYPMLLPCPSHLRCYHRAMHPLWWHPHSYLSSSLKESVSVYTFLSTYCMPNALALVNNIMSRINDTWWHILFEHENKGSKLVLSPFSVKAMNQHLAHHAIKRGMYHIATPCAVYCKHNVMSWNSKHDELLFLALICLWCPIQADVQRLEAQAAAVQSDILQRREAVRQQQQVQPIYLSKDAYPILSQRSARSWTTPY